MKMPRLAFLYSTSSIPVPHGLRLGPAAARLLGIGVRIPPGVWMPVSCEYCVLSGAVPEMNPSLIQRSPNACGVFECHLTMLMRRPWPTNGCSTMKNVLFITTHVE